MEDPKLTLAEMCAQCDQATFGMTAEEWAAKSKREAEDYWNNHPARIPIGDGRSPAQ